MAKQTKSQVQSENARLQAENEVLRALTAKPRLPSAPMQRALLAAAPGIQRKAYMERFNLPVASRVDVELWLEEMRDSLGLV